MHSDFQNNLLENLLAHAGHEQNVQRPIGRTPTAATQVVRFEEHGRNLGLFDLPCEEDVVCVRKRVSPEMFQ